MGRGQRAVRALEIQHLGPSAFLRLSSTGLVTSDLDSTRPSKSRKQHPKPRVSLSPEAAGWKQKLPRVSAVGDNRIRYTVRLAERGGSVTTKFHRLPNEDQYGDRKNWLGERRIRSSATLPSDESSLFVEQVEQVIDGESTMVDRFYWVQTQGARWLLTASLFGERQLELWFASKHTAQRYAEKHAGQVLAWERVRGRGKRARRTKAPGGPTG